MKYFPEIPEDVLRREWQSYRHLEPDYHKWLKFMHEQKYGGDDMGSGVASTMLKAVVAAIVIGAGVVAVTVFCLIKSL